MFYSVYDKDFDPYSPHYFELDATISQNSLSWYSRVRLGLAGSRQPLTFMSDFVKPRRIQPAHDEYKYKLDQVCEGAITEDVVIYIVNVMK